MVKNALRFNEFQCDSKRLIYTHDSSIKLRIIIVNKSGEKHSQSYKSGVVKTQPISNRTKTRKKQNGSLDDVMRTPRSRKRGSDSSPHHRDQAISFDRISGSDGYVPHPTLRLKMN
ncbi:hypothetical protein KIN20_028784 [Parelaphostrongylus tenuis]|uniref:Uncharacterized protein n=1 Tax=Parelaphostrongylus tenuis TaxID=148309 RepID=A0AAD5WF31_PARTN|nr:hypothetical protein KIN20_028784 [Parelaphostrongylus tenuis]